MPERRRIVAAGWYVGVGVTLLIAGIPPGFFDNPWFRGTLCVLGAMCCAGASYEWWFRKPDDQGTVFGAISAHAARPDIPTVDARVCWVVERDGGYAEWDTTLTPKSFDTAVRAVVVSFRNDWPTAVPRVRAELAYVNPVTMDVQRTSCGTWLGERLNRTSFGASETRDLVIALYDDNAMFAVNDNRRDSEVVSGCTKRPLPFTHFTAWVLLSVLEPNEQLVGKIEERVSVDVENGEPTVEIIGPPGAIRGDDRCTIADIDLICDEWSASIEVSNNGETASFSAMLMIDGPVKPSRTRDIYCQWAHTPSVEARIAKGQKCRLRLADRTRADGMNAYYGFSSWAVHALVDGHPFDVESMFHSTPFSDPPTVADDIVVTVEIVANPDLINGVQRRCVTLKAFKAVAA